MNTPSPSSPMPKSSPALIAVALVVIALAVTLIAWQATRHAPLPAPVATVPDDWLRAKAVESGGDIHRLSSADQDRVQTFTKGKGAMLLMVLAQRRR